MKKPRHISKKDWEQIHQLLDTSEDSIPPVTDMSQVAEKLLEEIKVIRETARDLDGWQEVDVNGDWERLRARLPHAAGEMIRARKSRNYFLHAAAIAIPAVVVISALLFLWLRQQPRQGHTSGNPPAIANTAGARDITLTLSDGRNVILDGGARFQDPDGAIIVRENANEWRYLANESAGPAGNNTLKIPPGKTCRITMADGSKIWLNAGSTLRYPTRFGKEKRQVEMTGEACYEVAGNEQPFIVKANNTAIYVLGTLFNVNAYSPVVTTTLASGKIAVSADQQPMHYLQPGQQAIYNPETRQLRITAGSPDIATAWKSGNIAFEDIGFSDLVTQLGRIYDYRVVLGPNGRYDTLHYNVPLMPKPADINTMLELIKATTKAGIDIQVDSVDRTIIVR